MIGASYTTIILYGVISWLTCCLLKPIYDYFRDPLELRRFPTPSVWAALTPFWSMWEQWSQRRSATIHKVHQKLGSIIRVSPNQLLFNDPRAIPEIYGHLQSRKFEKDTFYDKLTADSLHDIVTIRDHDEHSRKRRYLANSFALKTVIDMEPVIRKNFYNLLSRIEAVIDCEKDKNGFSQPLDIRLWLNYFTLDVIGDMAFGLPLGFLRKGNAQKSAQKYDETKYTIADTIDTLHTGVRYTLALCQFKSLSTVKFWKRLIGSTPFLARVTGANAASDFTNIAINQLRTRLKAGVPDRPSGDFFDNILSDRSGTKRDLPFPELVAESIVFLNAGSDTTAAALTNTLYFLIGNPECFQELRKEVDSRLSLTKSEDVLSYNSVHGLPYLRACIDETLRLRPPIAYPLQRIVTAAEGAMVLGRHIRQGTVVAVPPYSVHRDPEFFPDPERYNPARWLNKEDSEQINRLKNYTITFSTGPRACLGRHIAIVELQILISTLVHRYDMEFVHPNQELKIFERFQSNPGPLPICFRKRQIDS